MIATVSIDAIAAGGDGVARHEGLVVFVPRTAPGDLVRVELEPRGRFARALPLEVLTPARDRVDPPCMHYTRDACGGCQLQHMTYAAQLGAKQRIVRDAIERIGKRESPLPFVRPSSEEWRYRSKLTLAIRRRGGRWIAGLHRFDDPGRVFALSDCPITRRKVVRVWREVLAAADLFPEAAELRGSVRETADGFAFTLYGARRWTGHANLFAQVSLLAALWWRPDGGELRRLHTRAGAATGGAAGEAAESGAAFTQVNPLVAAELHRHVVTCALSYAPEHVIDGYAGAAQTAVPIAAAGVRVTAIELDPHAGATAQRRLAPPSTAVVARVEDVLDAHLPADIVLLNPPRAGLDDKVTAILEAAPARPRAIVYVSCNPATLARDLTRLPGYRIESLLAFDMFPQTAHVETVCELVPAR